jgi:two-component system response regulator HydG
MTRILVVEDQSNMRATVAGMLRGAGYEVQVAASGSEAIDCIAAEHYDAVLSDLRMEGTDGIAVLRRCKEISPLTEVIVMTAFGTIESAIEAMRLGAHDYVQKPFSEDELLVKVGRALEKRRLVGEVTLLAAEFRERYHLENIVGRSAPMRELLGRVIRVAPTEAAVLLQGESGTGKELLARAIHANSKRAHAPFVSVSCAAINATQLESELFGHVRGAFAGAVHARRGLFEEANGGTFFFDELAETPLSFQAKLLRALETGTIRKLGGNRDLEVNLRVIAASNQDLQAAIAERRLRQDLYYRLNVARFVLPPLRERREDIPLLVEHFRERCARTRGQRPELGEGVLDYLIRYDFIGNVRELQNMIEQGVALAENGMIQLEDIVPAEHANGSLVHASRALQDVIDTAETDAIRQTLRKAEGNRERAAELLGVSTTTLWRKMKRLRIEDDRS